MTDEQALNFENRYQEARRKQQNPETSDVYQAALSRQA